MGDDDFDAHHHNYWGNRDQVHVFHDNVGLEPFPLDGLTHYGCNAIGQAIFDFEDDGNHADPDTPAVDEAADPPRADAIFPGTTRLNVTVSWPADDVASGQSIPGIAFSYKPANERHFRSDTNTGGSTSGNCGLLVENGVPFEIAVDPLQFDPAHQWALSRWAFQLWASAPPGGTGGSSVEPPVMALGSVHVSMVAHYGGETYLDPPHPDFFGNDTIKALGTTSGDVNLNVLAEWDYPNGVPPLVRSPFGYENADQMNEITLPVGSIVPLRTIRLEINACVTHTGPPPASPVTEYLLAYHGADSPEYKFADLAEAGSGGCGIYVVEDPESVMADSPYENRSQWGFRIVPVSDLQAFKAEDAGYLKGEYSLTFTAYSAV